MRKIILVLVIFMLTGCYDYNELTDLAIVSSMIIDYKDDEYIVNLEILETKKNSSKTSFYLEGTGKSFEESLINTYSKTPKHLYFNHIFAIVLSKSLVENKLENIYDFFLVDNDVRKDSVFVICDEVQKLLNFETEDKLSIGETIKNVFNYSEIENGYYKTVNFRNILNAYLNDKNYYLSTIDIDKNVITLSDVYLISDNKLDVKIDSNHVLFLNILDNSVKSFIINLDDEIFEVYKYKMDAKVMKDKIELKINAQVRLFGKSNSSNSTMKDVEKIEQKISKYLSQYIKDSIDYMYDVNNDIYNFDYMFYQYYPNISYKGIYKELNYDINTSITFNEKGLMLNQIGDDKIG